MNTIEGQEKAKIRLRDFVGPEGYNSFEKLNKRLVEQYPERAIARTTLERKDFLKSHLTRVAYVGRAIAGAIVGEPNGRKFRADFLYADPKFGRSAVGAKLLQSICDDYDEVRLHASPLGYNPGPHKNVNNFISRTDALLRYYQRAGFVLLDDQNMVWRRKMK